MKSSVCCVRYEIQIYRSQNMSYRCAQRVKLQNPTKMLRLLSPLAKFLRFQAFQGYMISDVFFCGKLS